MANEHDETVEMTDERETERDNDTPPAAKPASQAKPNRPAPAPSDEDSDDEIGRLRAALSKANKEAKERRLKLEEFERAEEERRTAQLSEVDRQKEALTAAQRKATEAEQRATAAESARRDMELQMAVEREARSQGWVRPDAAWRLIDRDRITFDEEKGRYAGIKEAVEKVLKDFPEISLNGNTRPGGTPSRETQRRPDHGAATRQFGRQVDPYEQELIEMGRGGRM